MLRQIRSRLTYANVTSTLALFLVLVTGTAYASHLVVRSTDVVNDTLVSDDLKNGEAVTSADVVNGTLGGGDLQPNTLTGGKILESTLGRVPSATLGGLGRSNTGTGDCNPETGGGRIVCAIVSLKLRHPSRFLLIGWVRAHLEPEEASGSGAGTCYLASTSLTFSDTGTGTAVGAEAGGDPDEHFSITAVTDVFPAGQHSFGIDCFEGRGGIQYYDRQISAVALSSA